MLGWQPSEVVSFLTEPGELGPNGNSIFLLDVYQWSPTSQPTKKPVGALKGLLVECSAEKTEAEALAAIPANLFVYSNQLAAAYQEAMGGPGQLDDGDRVDWNPNMSGIEALIEECPDTLKLGQAGVEQRGGTQQQRVKETAERDKFLQEEFCRRWASAARRGRASPNKKDICAEMASDQRINTEDVTAMRIKRIVSKKRCP
ncbi:MAG: hypothetical protein K9L32_10255 [Chromatiaceae bacterium]|nr:hypothetical protein [Chromatiaceae bacterium]MCF8004566.1 hypothetical protein [Chromatiaceae bacterium]MCF8015263.1 hypothetical protein [Chromatiaceae bacterium]